MSVFRVSLVTERDGYAQRFKRLSRPGQLPGKRQPQERGADLGHGPVSGVGPFAAQLRQRHGLQRSQFGIEVLLVVGARRQLVSDIPDM